MFERAKIWARSIKNDLVAVYLAGRDSRTPWYAKALAIAIVAYALSPIDLIPDFVPIIGYLDDLIIVPLGILLIVRLIPASLMVEFRGKAEHFDRLPKNWIAGACIVFLWIAGAIALSSWIHKASA